MDAKLKEFDNEIQEIPIVIGDEEIRTGEVRHQVRVSSLINVQNYQSQCRVTVQLLLHVIIQ